MPSSARLIALCAAFGTGGLLTLMVLLNGTLATDNSALFASWVAHGTGTVAATLMLLMMPDAVAPGGGAAGAGGAGNGGGGRGKAPLWAYLGGVSGAVTVMLSAITLNSVLALSGTLALGLLGQVAFGLAADRWGLLGMPRRKQGVRDILALTMILAGSGLIIFADRLPVPGEGTV